MLSVKILPDRARAAEAREYSMAMHVLGIDIGGSGIKGAPVDVTAGRLLAARQSISRHLHSKICLRLDQENKK